MESSEDPVCRQYGCRKKAKRNKATCAECLAKDSVRKQEARQKRSATEKKIKSTMVVLGPPGTSNAHQQSSEVIDSDVEEIVLPPARKQHRPHRVSKTHSLCKGSKELTISQPSQFYPSSHGCFTALKLLFNASERVVFVGEYEAHLYDDITPRDLANSVSNRVYEMIGYRFTYVQLPHLS